MASSPTGRGGKNQSYFQNPRPHEDVAGEGRSKSGVREKVAKNRVFKQPLRIAHFSTSNLNIKKISVENSRAFAKYQCQDASTGSA
jgi:hypothetical protein